MGVSNMSESDAVRLAQSYANENGIKEKIERISFVDADDLPERFRSRGSFWVVAFAAPEQSDVVIEHDGVVLNIGDSDQEITVVG